MKRNYNGPLTLAQLKEASIKSFNNAIELLDDAEILFNSNRYARTLFLIRISQEEFGKFLIVNETIIKSIHEENIDWPKFWQRLSKHEEKTYKYSSVVKEFFNKNIASFADGNLNKAIPFWEYIKIACIYVDFHNESFRLPSEYISVELVAEAMESTKNIIGSFIDFDINDVIDAAKMNLTKI